MVFTGTLAAVNAALDGLSYAPTGGYSGTASIGVVINDLGNTGTGGILTDSETVFIQVGGVNFQQGANGYTGTEDTFINSSSANTSYGNQTTVIVDAPTEQALLRFDNMFGSGAGQIALGSTILNASLSVYVVGTDANDTVQVHQMLSSWSEASTWNSLVSGIQANNGEASTTVLQTINAGQAGWVTITGIESIVQDWANGGSNNGFAFISSNADGWSFYSSEFGTVTLRPYLTISYASPQPASIDLDANNSSGASGSGFVTTWTENGGPVSIADLDATLTDTDSTHLQSMTVTITNRLDGTLETLAAHTSGTSITASYNSTTGELTLTGNDTVGHYQQVLRSVTYNNSSESPNTTARQITIQAADAFVQSNVATATINITAVNDAPVMENSGTMTLTSITEDQTSNSGQTIASVIASAGGDRITDVDSSAVEGIAITGLNTGSGKWQYSLDGGTSWLDVGTVSNGSSLLLRSTDSIRFLPQFENGSNPDFTFRAWDQTSGTAGTKVSTASNGGTTAFSTATETASIVVTDVNDAPVLDAARTPVLNAMNEDAGAPVGAVGTLVSSLVDFQLPGGQVDNVADDDIGAQPGIAITGANAANGTWYYSTNNGTNWQTLGSVSDGSARLLAADSSTRIYFAPSLNYNGTINDAITFRAWDQSSGSNGSLADTTTSGGTTAFSSVTDTAALTVNAVNDNPIANIDGANAVEAGGVANGSSGTNPTGNVLTNDTDVDIGDTKNITGVVAGTAASASGSVGVTVSGLYGSLIIQADGSYTYTVDNNNPTVQALRTSGQTLADTFTYTMQDSGGLAASTQLVITIAGSNDAPVATADQTTAIEAGGTSNGTSGTNPTGNVLTNDTDVDTGDTQTVVGVALGTVGSATGNLGSSLAGNYGSITLNADGSYSYVVDNANAAVQALRGSTNTLQEVYTYTLTDSSGATSSTQLTITIEGRNDNLVVINDTAAAVEAGGASNASPGSNPTGNVLTNDTDVDSGDSKLVIGVAAGSQALPSGNVGSGVTGSYGSLVINSDGSYNYTVDNTNSAVQALRTSAHTLVEVFTYTARDAAGTPSSAEITITISGSNDAPVAVANTASVIEASGVANNISGSNPSGNVLTNDTDVDAGDTKAVVGIVAGTQVSASGNVGNAVAGSYGSIVLNSNGTYTYTLDNNNAAVEALNDGDSLTEVFTYTITDTDGLQSTTQITLTINGRTDLPFAVVDMATAVEDSGLANSVNGIDPTGNVLTNDISGNNKTVVGVAAGSIGSDVTGQVGASITGSFGSVVINSDGTYTYTLNNSNPAVEALLTSGDHVTDIFTYTMQDNFGNRSTTELTITVDGANDTPASVNDSGAATERGGLANATTGSNASGNVLTNDIDVDAGDTKAVVGVAVGTQGSATGSVGASLTGTYGSIVINNDGSYTYVINENNPLVQALRNSTFTLNEVFTYTMEDTAGERSTAYLTVTLHGANDTPTAVADVATAIEAGGSANGTAGSNPTGNVLTNDTDVDAGDTKTVTRVAAGVVTPSTNNAGVAVGGNYGSITINSDGSYVYNVDNLSAAVQALRTSGQTLTDTFSYTMTDTDGLTSTAQITVTIQGANDAIDAAPDNAIAIEASGVANATPGSNPSGNLLANDSDVDSGDSMTISGVAAGVAANATGNVNSTVNGLYGSIQVASNGSYTYLVNNNNAAVQALRPGDTLSDVFTYTVRDAAGAESTTQVAITVQGANDEQVLATTSGATVAEGSTGNAITAPMLLTTDLDNANSELVYSLTSVTTNGVVRLSGTALSLGQTFTQADINAGLVTYDHNDSQTSSDAFNFTVNDGSGVTSSGTFNFIITNVNDAPVLDNSGSMTLTSITEDAINNSGNTVADIIASATGDRITDVDPSTVEGIAITSLASGNGSWQYSLNGGSTWLPVGTVAGDSALLLRDSDLVRFVPNGLNGTTASFTFRAWDQTSGTAGDKADASVNGTTTAFSTATEVASINVSFVNDAPTVVATTFSIGTTNEDTASTPVTANSLLTSASYNDVDLAAAPGLAITAVAGNGTWQYSLDGTSWTNFGAVSANNALLLDGTDLIRYIPNSIAGETASLSFRAWDQLTGVASNPGAPEYADPGAGGGTTSFSVASATAQLSVTDVNDAPLLDNSTAFSMNTITEDAVNNSGQTVASIIASAGGNRITDADGVGSLEGIAIRTTDSGNGTWQYSLDSATTWQDVGTVLDGSALLLRDTDRIRLVPNGDNGTTASFTFRAWDQTSGSAGTKVSTDVGFNGGSTSISNAIGTVNLSVTSINDVPVAVADTNIAVEAGGIANANAGSDPIGNVLTNDTDIDTGDTKIVIGVDAGVQPSATGSIATPVTGSYGSITIAADGTYSYSVDNSNASVQALRTSSDTLTDVFTYTMQDSGGLTSTTQVTITIEGRNDTPYDISDSGLIVNENSANTTLAGTVTGQDVDAGESFTYQLLDSAGGRFAINNAGQVTVANSALLNREINASHSITVRVTDASGATFDKNFSVQINDVDEFDVTTPVDNSLSPNVVAEDAAIGTVVGITALATDADATTNLVTYSLDNDSGGLFDIDSSTGIVTVAGPLDYETSTSHTIVVRATSVDGSSTTQSFNIAVTDVNEAPVGAISDTDATSDLVLENSAVGSTVGITAFADDADGTDSISYSLDDSAGGRFAIDPTTGIVTVAGGIDREAAASYNITVRATSTDTSSTTRTFTIAIGDVDEANVSTPTDVDASQNEVNENATIGTSIGITANASDLDATNNAITYSLTSNPDSLFQIDPNTGVVTTAAAINREAHGAIRNITIQATSTDGSTSTQSFTIAINDLDEFDITVPTDTNSATNEVDENAAIGTAVGITANAFDLDSTNNAIVYSLADNPDGLFQIDPTTGIVTTAAAIDREAVGPTRSITIRATSSDGSIAQQTFTIAINDQNEFSITTPTDSEATTNQIDENASIGTAVGITANAFDLDATNNVTYSLVNNPDGLFQIDPNTGVVTTAAAIDRELVGASRSITVRATSIDGSTADQSFNISVNDLDEFDVTAPTDSNGSANSINENSPLGASVGIQIVANDSDATNSAITYSLDDSAGGLFQIDSVTGLVTSAGVANYEVAQSHNITVRASSSDGSFVTANFVIAVNDVNERPTASADTFTTTYADVLRVSANGLLANDSDPDSNPLTATLISGPNSGSLVLLADGSFVYTPVVPYIGEVSFLYSVSDGQLTSTFQTVTIYVTMPFVPQPTGDGGSLGGNSNPSTGDTTSDSNSSSDESNNSNNDGTNSGFQPVAAAVEAAQSDAQTNESQSQQSAAEVASESSNGLPANGFAIGSELHSSAFAFNSDSHSVLATNLLLSDTHSSVAHLNAQMDSRLVQGLVSTLSAFSRIEDELKMATEVQQMEGVEMIAKTAIGSGVVVWVVHVSQVVAALLAASSAWMHIDPLSILNASKDVLGGKTTDAAEALFDNQSIKK